MKVGIVPLAVILAIAASGPADAQGRLFYLEAQAVGGYSSARDKGILFSMSPDDPMQKPSIGFDWLQRFASASRDFGVVGLQTRLAYNHEPDRELELQVYNAYLKYKAGFANLWIGHDRPALGLSSYFDTHGLLLPALAMMGWGFDRDWGAGFSRDYSWGNLAGSLTTGSGMPIYFKGNYLASARISKGVLEQANYTIGLSAAYGEVLETMGYELMSPDPMPFRMGSVDLAYLWTRYENRIELMAGEKMDEPSYALFWRFTVNLLEENRLKLEAQPILWKEMGESSYTLSAGLSYQATADLAVRAIYRYSDTEKENAFVAQVYYYRRM